MFLLLDVAVHPRHFRNTILIREIRRNGGADGEIAYRNWFSYKISAYALYISARLFLLVALLTYSLFFLGGAIMCMESGLNTAGRQKGKTRNQIFKFDGASKE